MKKSLLTTLISALAVTATVGMSTSASACSRLVSETEYGTLLIRSADWVSSAPFDGHVSVFPVNSEREMRGAVDEYKTAFSQWQTKYHTISIEEHGAFNGLSGQTINEKGLSAMALSQDDSKPFLSMHKDNGAPAVNVSDVTTFIAENYATTEEVKMALVNKEFQIAWASAPNGFDHPATLHFSIVDKDGKILLVQVGEGGAELMYEGDSSSDLRVKTNDPLQEKQREYVSQFNLKDPKVASSIPWGISGKDRNARLLALSEHMDFDGLSYAEAVGRQKSTFDIAALVPFGVQDPNTGEDYPSFFSMQFNLDNGDIWFRSVITGKEVMFNLEDTKSFTKPMHADIQAQVDAGKTEISWK